MLAISEEFESYQGEGTLTGTRMYFVRTQGCGVGCYFCDTKYTWKEEDAVTKEEDIVARAKATGVKWVCITGGEPLEQDLTLLVKLLHGEGLLTQIETSGMYYHEVLNNIDHVVVSPKDLFAKKGIEPNDLITEHADEVKCVITKQSDIDYYINKYKDFSGTKIFQPVDSKPEIANLVQDMKAKEVGDWLLMSQQQKVLKLQ